MPAQRRVPAWKLQPLRCCPYACATHVSNKLLTAGLLAGTMRRFQEGSNDSVSFLGADVGPVASLLVAPQQVCLYMCTAP